MVNPLTIKKLAGIYLNSAGKPAQKLILARGGAWMPDASKWLRGCVKVVKFEAIK